MHESTATGAPAPEPATSNRAGAKRRPRMAGLILLAGGWVVCLAALLFAHWMRILALTALERTIGRVGSAIGLVALPMCTFFLARNLFRRARRSIPGDRVRLAVLVLATLVAGSASVAGAHRVHWDIRLRAANRIEYMPIDTAGYEIEQLPFGFDVSFARGEVVYFVTHDGHFGMFDDNDPSGARVVRHDVAPGPRMVFVSSRGVIFVARYRAPSETLRSEDGGLTWERVLDYSVWRMDEDEPSGTLFTGNYSADAGPKHAVVLRSRDSGKTWQEVLVDPESDHVHTIRWSHVNRCVFAAFGDIRPQPQLYSDDLGETWRYIFRGPKAGHTDCAVTDNHVVWGSDDGLGRVVLAPSKPRTEGRTVLWAKDHNIWWVVARGRQIYAGSYTNPKGTPLPAFLVASSDEGRTWQKLMSVVSPTPGRSLYIGESRRLSDNGWLYFGTSTHEYYRVRKTPERR